MRRDYSSISVIKPFTPHYNHSVGKYVRTAGEFKSELTRASDAHSERTGIDHDFRPIEMNEAPGVTSEGLDSTAKRKRDTGETQPTKRIFHG